MAKTAKAPTAKRGSNPSLKLTEFTASNIADAASAAGGRKAAGLYRIPVEGLTVIPGFNLRITDTPEYAAGLEELRDSILIEGFFDSKPLTCFAAEVNGEATVVLIDGHRRLAAAKLAIEEGADIETLPVTFKKPDMTDLDLAVALRKENASAPLGLLERAVLTERMLRAGETEEAVAERLQVTVRYINDMKVLMAAPKEVRDLVKTNKISGTFAIEQLRKDPKGEKLLAAAKAAEEKAKDRGGERTRVTRQTVADGDVAPAVKMVTHRGNFKVAAGEEFAYEDAAPLLSLIGDEDWFKKARKQTVRIALEDISVEYKIRRPAKTAEPEEPVLKPAPAKTAANGKHAPVTAEQAARKGANRRHRPEAFGEDLGLDDDGDAPDLKSLGIADPAMADL